MNMKFTLAVGVSLLAMATVADLKEADAKLMRECARDAIKAW